MRKLFVIFTISLVFAMSVNTFAQSVGARSAPPDPAKFRLDPVATGFNRALYVTHAGDGSGRLFLVEQSGRIHTVQNGSVRPQPFLDVSQFISRAALGNSYTEQGLLGLAFHPNYIINGQFFINYTENGTNDTITARYRVSSDRNIADDTSGEEIFRLTQPFGNHNGGHLAFGPDGYLYVSLGDGGSAGDPQNNGQQPDNLLGTILRIDVDNAADGKAYAIPADNPFANGGGAPEIWAYGLRNVWRFSFDRRTNDLYMGDVGQSQWEEINYQPAGVGGQNYGWNVFEGTRPYSGAAPPPNTTAPVAEYQHAGGHCSVTGGYVYRGNAVPTMKGAYIYGDFCSGQLWSTYRDASGIWQTNPLVDTPYMISSFGEDEDGELYLVHYGDSRIPGQVLRFSAVE